MYVQMYVYYLWIFYIYISPDLLQSFMGSLLQLWQHDMNDSADQQLLDMCAC